MKSDSPATATQIQQVAKLLGLAVLRWQRERERSEKLSNSLPERLDFSPENSLSVTGRRDPATCSVGRIRHKENVYDGVHEAIVETAVFDAVQSQLKKHGRSGGSRLVNQYNALLKGMLYCHACGYAMVHNPTYQKGKLYRYYVCQTAIKQGRQHCTPAPCAPPILKLQ